MDEGWVLARPNGSRVNPNAITNAFKNLRDELELPPVRLHDLRHTYASLLLKDGIHLKVVSERLGHSNIGITADIYSHVTPGMCKDAAQKFQDMLSKSEAEEATS
jgi:integrase